MGIPCPGPGCLTIGNGRSIAMSRPGVVDPRRPSDHDRPVASRSRSARALLQLALGARTHRDSNAFLGHLACNREADALAGPSDQGVLSVEAELHPVVSSDAHPARDATAGEVTEARTVSQQSADLTRPGCSPPE